MESAGTLPCAPEIPDCVEQVRVCLRRGEGEPPAAHWPRLVFLPLLHVFGVRETPEPPLKALWLQNQETDFEIGATRAPAEGGGAGAPRWAPSPRSAPQGEAESQGASVSCWSAAGGVTVSLFSLTPAGCPYFFQLTGPQYPEAAQQMVLEKAKAQRWRRPGVGQGLQGRA